MAQLEKKVYDRIELSEKQKYDFQVSDAALSSVF